ncbi:hypothetical protein B0H63DRAFT_482070 [Podospora didyma]|uniref:C2H2-type domain-containing protein n=1 Tax=Podospora didyma TaxID=330526 RepID=A0AAE0KFE5_9PEZI|nr:hypothetical protein B0H63DRAFT_482070 [Podospora didyma]
MAQKQQGVTLTSHQQVRQFARRFRVGPSLGADCGLRTANCIYTAYKQVYPSNNPSNRATLAPVHASTHLFHFKMKRSREPEEDEPPTLGPTTNAPPTGDTSPSPNPVRVTSNSNTITNTITNTHPSTTSRKAALSPSPAAKFTELEPETASVSSVNMRCSLPPHKEALVFSSYDEYEAHYRNQHGNRCHECRRNFPSAHFLDLHIEEMHDSFLAVKRERGEHTYSCFVEGCERKCSTPQKRRMHLIDKHMYPKNFFFAVTKEGIDGRQSLLLEGGESHRRRRSSVATIATTAANSRRRKPPSSSAFNPPSPSGEGSSSLAERPEMTDSEAVDAKHQPREDAAAGSQQGNAGNSSREKPAAASDVEMADLVDAMSSLRFIPPSVRFGRGGKKTGFSRNV